MCMIMERLNQALATGYPAQAPAALSKHTMIIVLVAWWIHLLCVLLIQPQDNRN